MSDASHKHDAVFVLGGTGTTGSSIVDGLLEAGKYRIILGVRPTSLSKPKVSEFRERGVEIRAIDLDDPTADALDAALKGADIVISTMIFSEVEKQIPLIDAAKRAGVKRFIPSDWAPPCVRGVRRLYDQKAAVQDYVKAGGLGYTFIDAALWITVGLPIDREESEDIFLSCRSHAIIGTGDVKNAFIHIPDIGKFVAKIIDDERTLNKYVFLCAEEKTQNEIWDIARKAKAENGGGPLKASAKHKSVEQVMEEVKSTADSSFEQVGADYLWSLFIRGDNTLGNAKKAEYGGALDAKELYPDLKVTTVEEVAKAIYEKE